ncbi:unnamed protein product [Angiostrongylus costaricensis]|uniref:Uncharacterized protein n=1 Tax=Angiostrongylus costaricensis TaxID=334426 RepID=A0A0R3PXP4_ANGCS|nr:unnamed protein product [Angiostrongylus costaricensis]
MKLSGQRILQGLINRKPLCFNFSIHWLNFGSVWISLFRCIRAYCYMFQFRKT